MSMRLPPEDSSVMRPQFPMDFPTLSRRQFERKQKKGKAGPKASLPGGSIRDIERWPTDHWALMWDDQCGTIVMPVRVG